MNKDYRATILTILISILLVSCAPSPFAKELYENRYSSYTKPINLIPMYGSPEVEKTDAQKQADEEFVRTIITNSGSRVKGAKEFAAWGWAERRKGNIDNAMRRFNQSWLLNQKYYQSYWGFGVISLIKNNPAKASVHFKKALSLIDDDREKPRLQVDAAKAYAWQGVEIRSSNSVVAEGFFKKAISLIEEALRLNPQYGNAYYYGARIYRDQGDYKKAWNIVKRSHAIDNYPFSSKFIEDLSEKMPEPR